MEWTDEEIDCELAVAENSLLDASFIDSIEVIYSSSDPLSFNPLSLFLSHLSILSATFYLSLLRTFFSVS